MDVEEQSQSWRLKYIRFPPIPRPSRRRQRQEGNGETQQHQSAEETYQRNYQIIMQDENGPCSLIALCNILILQDKIQISPPDQERVSYDKLAALVADYLISSGKSDNEDELGLALGIIPKTRSGLDVNIRFNSIEGFKGGDAERVLFKIAGIPLLHGWVATTEECEDIFTITRKKGGDQGQEQEQELERVELDYDSATDVIAQADSLVGGLITSPPNDEDVGAKISELNLSSEEQDLVEKGKKIYDWFQQNATQLTYHGLFSLSETTSSSSSSSLYALYRNHHISVLYRRLPVVDENGQEDPDEARKPVLFTLATDVAFVQRQNIVWESQEDVDGSASSFYDENLVLASTSSTSPSPSASRPQHNEQQGTGPTYETDLAMAQSLQEQEYQSQPSRQSQQNAAIISPPSRPPQHQEASTSTITTQKRKPKKGCIIQ